MNDRRDTSSQGDASRAGGGEWFRYDPGAGDSRVGSPPRGEAGLGSVPRRRRPSSSKRRRRWFGYVLVAVLALALGVATGAVRGYFAVGEAGARVTVEIASGDSLNTIATRLEEAGVVEHAGAFILRAQSDGYSQQLKPGTYLLLENQPYEDLSQTLIRGPAPVAIKVTIPEGTTLAQTAERVARGVEGVTAKQYVRAARDEPPTVKLDGYKAGKTLEGLLFPATYEVDPAITADSFVEKQVSAFTANMDRVELTRARKANLTAYEVVTIASMVEREAQVADERALVAAVIWNRLRVGMRLQIDATIQYALGETKPVLSYDDLKIDSPYNTYTHDGLPPTPIANPGLASLQAAANPAKVDYLYYVARADGTGKHYFSKSYEEFLANQAKAVQNSQ